MPRTIKSHLDDNAPRAVAEGLRRRGIDVTTTPEVGLLGASDEEQAAWCLAEGRVIFTQDHDFLAIHAASVPHAGIAFCKKDTLRIGAMVRGLILIWEFYEPEEMTGRVEYL
jgi:predicted nuclease of predicted toxin-antitoxin system